MNEEWRPVEGFPLYDVSNFGRVRHRQKNRILKQRHLEGKIGPRNFEVDLHDGQRRVGTSVAQLVAKAFVVNPDPKRFPYVNHKDGDASHNWADNLKWSFRLYLGHSTRRAMVATTSGGTEYVFPSMLMASETTGCMLRQLRNKAGVTTRGTFGRKTVFLGVKLYWRYADPEDNIPPPDCPYLVQKIGTEEPKRRYNDPRLLPCGHPKPVVGYIGMSTLESVRFVSLKEASLATGVHPACISDMLHGRLPKTTGKNAPYTGMTITWRYAE